MALTCNEHVPMLLYVLVLKGEMEQVQTVLNKLLVKSATNAWGLKTHWVEMVKDSSEVFGMCWEVSSVNQGPISSSCLAQNMSGR